MSTERSPIARELRDHERGDSAVPLAARLSRSLSARAAAAGVRAVFLPADELRALLEPLAAGDDETLVEVCLDPPTAVGLVGIERVERLLLDLDPHADEDEPTDRAGVRQARRRAVARAVAERPDLDVAGLWTLLADRGAVMARKTLMWDLEALGLQARDR